MSNLLVDKNLFKTSNVADQEHTCAWLCDGAQNMYKLLERRFNK